MKTVIAFFFILATSLAYPGNGTSGGAHLHGDGINPWFLQNTKDVSYCIKLASNFSTVPKDRISELVKQAFYFWKKQLVDNKLGVGNFPFIYPAPVIGSQTFIERECIGNEDITFDLGTVHLTDPDNSDNEQPVVGMTYRTHYDKKTMKGRGTIYIAPDSGPGMPTQRSFLKGAWAYGNNSLLLFTLIHEIGHIFGIYHTQGDGYGVMDTHFVETIVSLRGVILKRLDEILAFPRFGKGELRPLAVMRSNLDNGVTIIGDIILPENVCNHLGLVQCQLKDATLEPRRDGAVLMARNGDYRRSIGQFNGKHAKWTITSSRPFAGLWAPKEQSIFKIREWFVETPLNFISVASSMRIEGATFHQGTTLPGAKVDIKIQSNGGIEVGALIQNTYHHTLFPFFRNR